MKYECPECSRTIFNRRLDNCEFCSAAIPENLKFSDADKKQIENEHQELMKRECEIEPPLRRYVGGAF
ncbi:MULTISPECIES: hypothetical protein [Shewanella]|uniref:Uncharacterized protein n=1 Tax=Shewanella salipaludis TaxID=2723052 RepID=A0A972G2F5_9GAMM|nr:MULTISPECIES: hypothetical protein [Shewanella]MCE9685670.1 hypothetical protein [Shewanella sp. AS16]NMH65969.1 hypothetical protein [Shewanella salipaludis]